MGAERLNQPVFSMSPTKSGNGDWLVARDGGIFTFGDGAFYGSMGATRPNQPVNGITTSPTGNGYRRLREMRRNLQLWRRPLLRSLPGEPRGDRRRRHGTDAHQQRLLDRAQRRSGVSLRRRPESRQLRRIILRPRQCDLSNPDGTGLPPRHPIGCHVVVRCRPRRLGAHRDSAQRVTVPHLLWRRPFRTVRAVRARTPRSARRARRVDVDVLRRVLRLDARHNEVGDEVRPNSTAAKATPAISNWNGTRRRTSRSGMACSRSPRSRQHHLAVRPALHLVELSDDEHAELRIRVRLHRGTHDVPGARRVSGPGSGPSACHPPTPARRKPTCTSSSPTITRGCTTTATPWRRRLYHHPRV